MKNVLHVFSLLETAETFFDGQFSYLGNFGLSIHLIASPAENTEAFSQRNNTKYSEVEISRSISPLKDLKAVIAICQYIKNENIGIVVGHTPKGAFVSMIASFLMRVPQRIYYRHGLIYTTKTGVARFILKSVEKFVSSLSTKIISVSLSMAALCVEHKINTPDKQQLIGKGTCGGIDTKHKFNPAIIDKTKINTLCDYLKIEHDAFVIGFAGRLSKDKGVEQLVDGFNILLQNYPEKKLTLLLVGKEDSRDGISTNVFQAIKSNQNIIKTGWMPLDEMKYYYALMSVFVLPSHREGFGMSVIEASAMEIPVLVSRSHGCIDTIIENKTGFYINLTAEGIAQGVTKLFDAGVRMQLGKAGRTWVVENFDQTVLWPEVVKIYQ